MGGGRFRAKQGEIWPIPPLNATSLKWSPLITFVDFRDSLPPLPYLHFPSKLDCFPFWVLPKFSVIPFWVHSYDWPPFCSPKNQVTLPPCLKSSFPAPNVIDNDRSLNRSLSPDTKGKGLDLGVEPPAIKLFLALPPRGHECSENISYHEAENLKTNKTFYFLVNSYLRVFIQGLTIGWIAVKNLKSLIIPILCSMIHCRSTIFHCWSCGHRSRILPGKSEKSLCPPKVHVWVLELNAGLQVYKHVAQIS